MKKIKWLDPENILFNVECMTDEKFELYSKSLHRNFFEIKELVNQIMETGVLPPLHQFIQNDIYCLCYIELSDVINQKTANEIFDICNKYKDLIDSVINSSIFSSKEEFTKRIRYSITSEDKKDLYILKKNFEKYLELFISKNMKDFSPSKINITISDLKVIINSLSEEERKKIYSKEKELKNYFNAWTKSVHEHIDIIEEFESIKACLLEASKIKANDGHLNDEQKDFLDTVHVMLNSFLVGNSEDLENESLIKICRSYMPAKDLKRRLDFYHSPITIKQFDIIGKSIVKEYRNAVEVCFNQLHNCIVSLNVPYDKKDLSHNCIGAFVTRNVLKNMFLNTSISCDRLIESIESGAWDFEVENIIKILNSRSYFELDYCKKENISSFKQYCDSIDEEELDVYFKIMERLDKSDNELITFLTSLSIPSNTQKHLKYSDNKKI